MEPLTGEVLYEKWRRCMAAEEIDVDEWNALPVSDMNAWRALALELGGTDD